MSRRKFLKQSGHLAATSWYVYGLQALLDACLQSHSALASEIGNELRYLHIVTPGAPPAWMFDQPLNPNNRRFTAGVFGTELRIKDDKVRPIHKAYKMKFGNDEVFMPPVWRLKSASSDISFQSLLENTMMIRGIDMEINSHGVNQGRLVRPVTSLPSVTGLLADQSKLPLPAAGVSGRTTSIFKSEKGLAAIRVNPRAAINGLSASFSGKITPLEDLSFPVEQALTALDRHAASLGQNTAANEDAQMAAYKMFEKNIRSFEDAYKKLIDKYVQIVNREIRAVFPKVTNVGGSADNSGFFKADRNQHTTGPLSGFITSQTNIDRMAWAFAFAEFALTENLSSALTVNLGNLTIAKVNGNLNISNDQHFVGASNSVLFTSLHHRAKMGCLLELRSALQQAGLFDKTLIHLSNEFSRTPNKDGEGSDHGFNGSSATLISGMIKTPGLIGNIRRQAKDSRQRARYPGTYGEAAPILKEDGVSRPLVNDDIVNTVCFILGVRQVAVKGGPLVKKDGNSISWAKKWGFRNV